MKNPYLEIEKICLEQLYNEGKNVCCFDYNGIRYISDSYCIWALPEEPGREFRVVYENSEKMIKRVLFLMEKYSNKLYYKGTLQLGNAKILSRGHAYTEFECIMTGEEIYLQDKYVNTFEPFGVHLCSVAVKDAPVLVMSNEKLIGLIMPMYVTEEIRAKRAQSSFMEEEEND